MCDEFGRTKITNFNKREEVSLEAIGMFGPALLGLGLSGSPGPLLGSYKVAFPLVSLRVFFFFFFSSLYVVHNFILQPPLLLFWSKTLS